MGGVHRRSCKISLHNDIGCASALPSVRRSSLLRRSIQAHQNSPICKAVYLHVIIYNVGAIGFYERNNFLCMTRRRNFYFIKGQHFDSFVYMMYVNGGRRPTATPSTWSWRCCIL